MLRLETFTCRKCGKPFTRSVGGIILTPRELALCRDPLCARCSLSTPGKVFTQTNNRKGDDHNG